VLGGYLLLLITIDPNFENVSESETAGSFFLGLGWGASESTNWQF
jgi:hypothetical protein